MRRTTTPEDGFSGGGARLAPPETFVLPLPIASLRRGLASAFDAADTTRGLDIEHRVRIYHDLASFITDSASAAARAGHAAWALQIIDTAAGRPPAWAQGHAEQFWTRLLDNAREAVLSTIGE